MEKIKYYSHLKEAKEVYKQSGNISAFLREKLNLRKNTPEIIEISYNLQSGSYVDLVQRNPERHENYCSELAGYLDEYIDEKDSLLEIGCGEATKHPCKINYTSASWKAQVLR